MTKSSTILIAGLALAGLTGCVDRAQQAQAKVTEALVLDPSVHVALAPVSVKTLSRTVDITGNLTTADDVQIGAKQPGRIVSVFVKDGDPVTAGQIIAQSDTSQLREQLQQALGQLSAAEGQLAQARSNKIYGPAKSSSAVRQAEANLRSAQATLKKSQAGARPEERAQTKANLDAAKANLDIAKRDLDRKRALVDEGALARTSLDAAENTYTAAMQTYENAMQAELETERGNRTEDVEVAKEGVRQAQEQLANAKASQKLDVTLDQAVMSAQGQVDAAKAEVDLARSNLSDSTIRAPFSGRISGNPIQVGTVVSAGTAVAHLIGGQGAYFEGQLPEGIVPFAKPGAAIDVTVDAVTGRTFQGKIVAVNPLGNQIGRFFTVRISLSGDLSGLKPNMFAHGALPVKTASDATVVPGDSIVTKDGKSYLFTVADNKAKAIEIKPGVQVGESQQVTGIPAGTLIVVKGQSTLADGTPVKVDEQTKNVAEKVGQ